MMRLLCTRYSQCFIALVMLFVLYGKSVVCVKSMLFNKQYVSAEDYGETSTQDGNETEKESSVKSCKKSWVEMESGQLLLPADPLQSASLDLLSHYHCSALERLYQRVPTPPPLDLMA